jgi:hypothetical protein
MTIKLDDTPEYPMHYLPLVLIAGASPADCPQHIAIPSQTALLSTRRTSALSAHKPHSLEGLKRTSAKKNIAKIVCY